MMVSDLLTDEVDPWVVEVQKDLSGSPIPGREVSIQRLLQFSAAYMFLVSVILIGVANNASPALLIGLLCFALIMGVYFLVILGMLWRSL